MSALVLPWDETIDQSCVPVPISDALLPDAKERLEKLAGRIQEDIRTTSHHQDWIPRADADGQPRILDVLVIGGGQAGLGVAFALKRERIDRVAVVDAGDDPMRVGPWNRYARMHTLRSPKSMKGIELDVPSLHIQRWFEACYGEEAWAKTDLVPRLDWNDYLVFYRWVTQIEVHHKSLVTAVRRPETDDGPFAIDVRATTQGGLGQIIYARRVVFALGLIGGGGAYTPDIIRALPRSKWFHTEEEFDVCQFQGRRIAVLGGGASGFDNAGTALEAGAAEATVFMRRSTVPSNNPLRWMEFPGMQEHFFDLSDEQKVEFSLFNGGLPQPPTQHTIWRCFSYPSFQLRRSEEWVKVDMVGDKLEIHTIDAHGTPHTYHVDAIIAATGYKVDLKLRPEMQAFFDDILTWGEAYPASANTPVANNPYLGSGFEFTPRHAEAPWIARLHHFSTGARTSMGVTGNQLSGIYGGLKRMAWSIATAITRENWPELMRQFRAFEHREVTSVGPHDLADPPYASGPRYCGEHTAL
ncbi:hypothetical protein MNAN1_003142 [Malassezia nana]|uniref:Uncharacterized protein n=1 Tax=Malassezia nana TaxID=180528 RepID=A0AAF0EP16_9BASI|nr:hypothetical protein MNAN1_003142 [Malassezia nana]